MHTGEAGVGITRTYSLVGSLIKSRSTPWSVGTQYLVLDSLVVTDEQHK